MATASKTTAKPSPKAAPVRKPIVVETTTTKYIVHNSGPQNHFYGENWKPEHLASVAPRVDPVESGAAPAVEPIAPDTVVKTETVTTKPAPAVAGTEPFAKSAAPEVSVKEIKKEERVASRRLSDDAIRSVDDRPAGRGVIRTALIWLAGIIVFLIAAILVLAFFNSARENGWFNFLFPAVVADCTTKCGGATVPAEPAKSVPAVVDDKPAAPAEPATDVCDLNLDCLKTKVRTVCPGAVFDFKGVIAGGVNAEQLIELLKTSQNCIAADKVTYDPIVEETEDPCCVPAQPPVKAVVPRPRKPRPEVVVREPNGCVRQTLLNGSGQPVSSVGGYLLVFVEDPSDARCLGAPACVKGPCLQWIKGKWGPSARVYRVRGGVVSLPRSHGRVAWCDTARTPTNSLWAMM